LVTGRRVADDKRGREATYGERALVAGGSIGSIGGQVRDAGIVM